MTRRATAFGLAACLWLWAPGFAGADVTLTVTPLRGGRDIDFGNARSMGPEGEPAPAMDTLQQVQVAVNSTTTNRYQVFIRINDRWRNLAGEELPMENVQFFISDAGAGATVRFPNPTAMALGEQEILQSDQSEAFLITFIVRVPHGQQAGDYRTTLSFRVVSQ